MIRSLLIANRGEIACRIIRTCRELGIRAVAVFSDADAGARHVQLADEAIHIGASPASESYLVADKLIAAALRAQVDAVHPGFGFLAESADFARACAKAGLIFIGPAPEAIAAMGNKRAARQLAATAGVPIIPGTGDHILDDAALTAAADAIGYPVMVKAAAGGGGKGMRLVAHPADLADALAGARREALQAFGSDELILERALRAPRHIEIQVFGDAHGRVIHLGERECSIQRRHQKVIEEAPSPAVDAELRARMGATAVGLAQAIGYTNAGTVEFLLDSDDQFYFLEMNTRLQVEHPVTEMVIGVDLVAWQIAVAEGRPLPLAQPDVVLTGHAVEARVYAENPANNFLPVTGEIVLWEPPRGAGVRVESGINGRDRVSVHYDPMLAKIIARGDDRPTAVRRLRRALETTTLLGLPNNLCFLQDVLEHPAFWGGALSTGFIADHFPRWQPSSGDEALALLAVTLQRYREQTAVSPTGGYWRNNPAAPLRYRYRVAERIVDVALRPQPRRSGCFDANVGETAAVVQWIGAAEARLTLAVDGYRQTVTAVAEGVRWWVQTGAGVVELVEESLLPEPRPLADAGGSLRAPMPGAVLAVLVSEGDQVEEGQPLMKLEAMKMEHTIRTAAAGVVEKIFYAAGDTVEADAQLLFIREA